MTDQAQAPTRFSIHSRAVEVVRVHHDLGHADAKGRRIGAEIRTSLITVADKPADHSGGYYGYRPAGRYYAFVPHATRNGVHYGASQRETLFAKVEERDAAIEKYLANARKRAAKQG